MKSSLYNGYKVNLVETVEEIELVKSFLHKEVMTGLDTETKSLNFAPGMVVGICIACGKSYSKNDFQGFYLPIRHKFGNNLPKDKVYELVQYQLDNFKVVFWNRPFDNFMLEMDGVKIPFVGHTHDGQIMAHLAFSESFPALKDFAKNLLRFDTMSFSDNEAEGNDFSNTDPNVSYRYAAQDPLITVLVARKLWAEYPYIRKIYPLDNVAGEAVRLMEKSQLYLDYEIIEKELSRENKNLSSIRSQIFGITGYEFKLDSNVDKADALSRFVSLTKKTKGGKFAVDAETLSDIDHPLARLLVKYAEVKKYISTYLKKMLSWREEEKPLRVAYSACNALSGRLSSGGAKGNDYFVNFNIQNVPKEEIKGYVHKGGVCGYYVNGDATELVPVDLSDERVSEEVVEVQGFNLTLDNGKVLSVPYGTLFKVRRNGVEQAVSVENIAKEDELIE